jgi:hypothetical protein
MSKNWTTIDKHTGMVEGIWKGKPYKSMGSTRTLVSNKYKRDLKLEKKIKRVIESVFKRKRK